MCLYRANAKGGMGGDNGAYVIPQEAAYAYADSRGNPTSHLITSSLKAAVQLGFSHMDKQAAMRIIDIIVGYLPDLVRMPSIPQRPQLKNPLVQGIEVALKVDGKTIHEALM